MDIKVYIFSSIRPFSMLIFIESIAWFLLRQYRSLIEDYKNFYAVYLKKSNFISAIKLLSDPNYKNEQQFSIILSLISLDFKETLKSSDATKIIESEPIREIAKMLVDKIPNKTEKEKS